MRRRGDSGWKDLGEAMRLQAAGGISWEGSENLLELPLGGCYNYYMSIDSSFKGEFEM